MPHCHYCHSSRVRTTYREQRHKVDRTFGPFDLFECLDCGSMGTANPPTAERLSAFYQRYDKFRPSWYKAGVASGALSAQHRFYAQYVTKKDSGSWIDIGAGEGEVASLVSATNAEGMAIDIGPRPTALSSLVAYMSIDMNQQGWSRDVGRQFSNVFSVAVWEHVLSPKMFALECLSLVAPGGRLTLICPNYSSIVRKVLGRHWPYFEPGEHISIPSIQGAEECLSVALKELNLTGIINVKRLSVGYSLKYLFHVLRLKRLAAITPANVAVPLPTGILAAQVQLPSHRQ